MTRLSLKNYKKTQTQFALVDIHASGASGSAASVPLPYSCTSPGPVARHGSGAKKKRERGKASMVITKPAVFQPFTQAEPVEADGHPEIHILIGPRGANVEQGKESHGQATAGNHNLTSPFHPHALPDLPRSDASSSPIPARARWVVVTGRSVVSYIRQGRGSHATPRN
jgi:hypothetical protein